MKRLYILVIGVFALSAICGCRQTSQKQETETSVKIDSTALVLRLQQCSKIYSSEYKIHKIVTNKDVLKLEGNVINHKVDIPIPNSSRKIAIPIDITVKGYTDMSQLDSRNILTEGKKITVILPDPKFAVTSVKIDRKNIIKSADLIRSAYLEQEINQFVKKGEQSVYKNLPWDEFIKTARSNAAHTLFPILQDLGFEEIHIQYRDDLNAQEAEKSKLLFKNIENR